MHFLHFLQAVDDVGGVGFGVVVVVVVVVVDVSDEGGFRLHLQFLGSSVVGSHGFLQQQLLQQ